MKLIANWRQSWRLWSVRVSAIGAALFALLIAAPDFLLSIWSALPAEVQGLVPNSAALGLIVSLAAGVARIVQQRGASASATVAEVLALLERVTAAEVSIAGIQSTITSKADTVSATHRLAVDANGNIVGLKVKSSAPDKIGGADWEGVK